jgi:hypothetical protein
MTNTDIKITLPSLTLEQLKEELKHSDLLETYRVTFRFLDQLFVCGHCGQDELNVRFYDTNQNTTIGRKFLSVVFCPICKVPLNFDDLVSDLDYRRRFVKETLQQERDKV